MDDFATTALIPGSFDPPHKGHIAMIERAVATGIAEKFVVAAISNPTKKRLLEPENSVGLLDLMLPAYLNRCVVIEDGSDSTLAAARRHDADIIVRGGVDSTKDVLHEFVLRSYFNLAALCQRQSRLRVQRPARERVLEASSTKVRQLLSDNHHNNYFQLINLVGQQAAEILIEARDATPYQLAWPEGRRLFNSRLSGLLSQRK